MSYRTNIFIDKLNITYDVRRELHSRVLGAADGLAIDERLVRIYRSDLLNNYQRAYEFEFGCGEKLKIQMHPWVSHNPVAVRASRGRRFIRLEWNPRKARLVDPHSWQCVMHLLSELIPGFTQDSLLNSACITRMDLAFDLYGQHVNALQIFSLLRRAFSGHYVHGPAGTTNAIEIGRPDGDKYLRVYNKRLERQITQIEVIASPTIGSRVIRRRRSWTRFELQLRDVGSFARLEAMANPFAGFTVRTVDQIATLANGYIAGWFLDSCRFRGVHAALSTIQNQRARTKYANLVRQAEPPHWWDAEILWLEMPAALQEVFGL